MPPPAAGCRPSDVGGADAGNAPGQLQGVPGHVAKGDNGVVLVVMPHDADGFAETAPERRYFVNKLLHDQLSL